MKKDTQLANDIKKLQYQLSYSEHINKELSQYLKHLQDRTGIQVKAEHAIQNLHSVNAHTHLMELFYVQPLLMAYQNKIMLLETEIKEMEGTSSELQQAAQKIVSENNFLRKELESKSNYILKCEQAGIQLTYLKLDNSAVNQQNKLLVQKNEFLTKKVKEMAAQVEEGASKSRQPINDLYSLEEEVQSLRKHSKELEVRIIQLEKQLQVAKSKCQNELVMRKEEEKTNQTLENELLKAKNDFKILKNKFQNTQTHHQSQQAAASTQIDSLKAQLKALQRRENDLFNKNMLLENQLQQKSAKIQNLNLQTTQLQSNNNSMLQMLETYQVKVSNLSKKIKNMQIDAKVSSEESAETQKQFELLSWKLQQNHRQMEHRQQQFKKQRERQTKMWEDRIETLKKGVEDEKEVLYSEISELKQQKLRLQLGRPEKDSLAV